MTAPCDAESAPETRDEEQEIVLRLGDILPRVPGHLLKPGPHEARTMIRFSVDELAEKISRGRASVSLERLAAACPEVFRESSGFPGEQEIQLPLQKLLEQVGLVAPKGPGPNGVPKEQVAQARAQAERIIEAGPVTPVAVAAVAAVAGPAKAATAGAPGGAVGSGASETMGGKATEAGPKEPEDAVKAVEAVQPARMAKAISAARQILGMLSRAASFEAQAVPEEKHEEEKPILKEKEIVTEAGVKMVETAAVEEEAPGVQTVPASQTGPGPEVALVSKPVTEQGQAPAERATGAARAVPAGCISVRVLPIFRLLPSELLTAGKGPSERARVVLPLAMIDPQLAGGHVEIPLEDFIKGLPEELRGTVREVPGTKVWIPLDEIFQSLPADHSFHMPAIGLGGEAGVMEEAEPVVAKGIEKGELIMPIGGLALPRAEPGVAQTNGAHTDEKEDVVESTALPPVAEGAEEKEIEKTAENVGEAEGGSEATGTIERAEEGPVSQETEPLEASAEAEEVTAKNAESAESKALDTGLELEGLTAKPSTAGSEAEEVTAKNAENAESAESKALDTGLELEGLTAKPLEADLEAEEVTAENAESAESKALKTGLEGAAPVSGAQAPARAAWMRGFQVPPPRLFAGRGGAGGRAEGAMDAVAAETGAGEESTREVEVPPQAAPTPEAKRTADFLANQNGVFAAAAFVQGAVFASEDFPRKPDLDALRDFMGSFVDEARESGQRLGWNRVLTIACEDFYATAVVRETHFIVALHYDRVLPTLAHDALIAAADELSKGG